jgi:hypothetical protein
MSDINEIVDVLIEIRDVLEDIRTQNDIALKSIAMRHNEHFELEEKLIKYRLKLLHDRQEGEDE